MKTLLPIAALSALFFTGCSVSVNTKSERAGPTEHEKRSIEMDKSEAVRLKLKMGAGQLKITGGAPDLMDADFTYNIPTWKPEVRYTAGAHSDIEIDQPGTEHNVNILGEHVYNWDLKVNDSKPLSVNVEFGAGQCEMDLGTVTLQNVEVQVGVGKLNLDLRGDPKQAYQVKIQGGIGEANVYLPENAGIVAYAQGGIGSINAPKLHKVGERYVNDAYMKSTKTSIRLDISGGIGSINLIGG